MENKEDYIYSFASVVNKGMDSGPILSGFEIQLCAH